MIICKILSVWQQRGVNQCCKCKLVKMPVVYCGIAMDKMNMFPIAHIDGRPRFNSNLMKMPEKISQRKYSVLVTAAGDRDHLTGYSGKPVVMPVVALFGKFGACFEFMRMRLHGLRRTGGIVASG